MSSAGGTGGSAGGAELPTKVPYGPRERGATTGRLGQPSGKISPMLILALETSTDRGSCALWRDGDVVERLCPPGRSHSETLLPLVRDILAEARVALGQFDAIAFGAGPGAFTGLRVACGVAQGLAVGVDRPVVPIVTLEAMAAACQGTRVVTLLDARMNEVYAACYERLEGELKLAGEITVSAPERVTLPPAGDWVACGNALAAYPELADRVAAAAIRQDATVMPTAARVAELAVSAVAAGLAIDPALAAPLYIRDKVAKTVAERLAEGGRA